MNLTDPSLTSYPGRPASTYASVDLPDPFGPMIACTSPAGTCSDTPLRIGLSATVACRFVISSIKACLSWNAAACRPARQKWQFRWRPKLENSSHAPLKADPQQFLRLDGELHRQLL